MTPRWVPLFCMILIHLAGCSGLRTASSTVAEDTSVDRALLADLMQRNGSLKTFKGIGRANVQKDETEYFVRLAWAGAEPGKLRVEMIGAPGQPKLGFSSDGQWLYYTDPDDAEDPVKKRAAKNPDLKTVLMIPVTSTEIVDLLSGRIPDYAPHRLGFRTLADAGGSVLVLEKQWWQGVRYEIFLDSEKKEVRKIECYKAGRLAYRIVIPKIQTVKGYRVPSELIFYGDDGGYFKLRIDRYWANAELPPEVFVLKPPRNSE